MHTRLHRCLLILVTLAVAAGPLRGAWALPDTDATGTKSHCAGMQHDMQPAARHAGHDREQDSAGNRCNSGCDGSCCDQDCTTCLHATAALPATLITLQHEPARTIAVRFMESFPERPPTPPLRPPLALLG
jgi:hypothetical protein